MFAVAAESIGRADLVDDFDKFSRLDGFGIDGETLFEVDQMRGGKKTGSQPVAAEGFCQQPTDGAFSLGPCDMDHRRCQLGIFEQLQKISHPGELEVVFGAGAIGRLFKIDSVEQVVQGFLVAGVGSLHVRIIETMGGSAMRRRLIFP